MAETYIATFFSHYDAVQFAQDAKKKGVQTKLMPVPRKVSSSCGTGAQFEAEQAGITSLVQEGVDKIFLHQNGAYSMVYEAE